MAEFNGVNRGVYIADNLDFLRSINTESVDLVNIDPPFAKNDTFTADSLKPPFGFNKDGSKNDEQEVEDKLLQRWGIFSPEDADKAGIAFPEDENSKGGYTDTWYWNRDVHPDWLGHIESTFGSVKLLIDASKVIHGEGIAAYLSFMAVRLIEIHRILKPTGSLFIHCDHSANGYLRQLLDAIFGKDNFRNEIAWCYPPGGKAPKFGFHRKHDTIFYYGKSESKGVFNHPYEEMPPETVATYKKVDENGRHYKQYPGGRQYLDETPGRPIPDWWKDIASLGQAVSSGERTGYPTQKPVALAERIIKAATNPGDVVLDVFAGCAYTAVAAERLGRNWTACDINPRAWTVFKRQFNKGGKLPVLACNDTTVGQQVLADDNEVTIHGYKDLPTLETPLTYDVKPLKTENKARQPRKQSELFNRKQMLEALLEFSDGKAWCCGYQSRNADATLDYGNYELDHIIPQSHGGEDSIINRAPLCKAHNILKSNLDIELEALRVQVAMRKEMKVNDYKDLVQLPLARLYAVNLYKEAHQRKYGNQKENA